MSAIGTAAVAKKKSDVRRMNALVRMEDDLVEKGKKVAALKGMTLGEYFSSALWPIVRRDLAKEVRKLAEEQEGEAES